MGLIDQKEQEDLKKIFLIKINKDKIKNEFYCEINFNENELLIYIKNNKLIFKKIQKSLKENNSSNNIIYKNICKYFDNFE